MSLALRCVDAGCVINDLADAGKTAIKNRFLGRDAEALRDIDDRGGCLDGIDLVGLQHRAGNNDCALVRV
ncbi:MAG: hypothetical protein ACO2YV_10130, partial [Pseudomonadales bacterium]